MLYKLDPITKVIAVVNQTDLVSLGLQETKDLENWITSSRSIFDRNLIWIARQDWITDSDRSDIVGIDEDAELLVVELKRGYVDASVLTQALNYAAEYASRGQEEIINLFVSNSIKATSSPLQLLAKTSDEANRVLADHTHASDINETQAILLVGTQFDPRVLSMCEYLNRAAGADATLSVECWQIALFRDGTSTYLTLTQIVPTPDLRQQIQQMKEERQANKYLRDKNRIDFMWNFKGKARTNGYQVLAKRGSSYACQIVGTGGLPMTLSIHGDPTLTFPADGNYSVTNLDARRLRKDSNAYIFNFLQPQWDDPSKRELLADEILSVLAAMRGKTEQPANQVPEDTARRLADPQH
jgi:hypothetical protein